MACACGYSNDHASMADHIIQLWHFPACETCTKAFTTSERLRIHQFDTVHCGRAIATEYEFMCSCRLLCTDLAHLLRHLSTNAHAHYRSKADPTSLQRSPLRHACKVCSRGFENLHHMQRHVLEHHTNATFCPQCNLDFIDSRSLKSHLKVKQHCYCGECDLYFESLEGFLAHGDASLHVSEYKCLNCDIAFESARELDQHLKDAEKHKKAEPAAAAVIQSQQKYCSDCDRHFKSHDGLRAHRESPRHKWTCNLRCPLSKSCKKHFHCPSALVNHLESGACSSGTDRHKLNALVQTLDSGRQITDGQASNMVDSGGVTALFDGSIDGASAAGRRQGNFTPQLAQSFADMSMSTVFGKTPEPTVIDTLSDTDLDEGGVALPPSNTISRTASFYGNDLISTSLRPDPSKPVSVELTNGCRTAPSLSCPLCPTSRRPFGSLEGLEAHMTSLAHAPKIYRCPAGLVGMLGIKGGQHDKRFKSLGGLTQHLEAGACATSGQEMMGKAMAFVELQMKALGCFGWAAAAAKVKRGIAM